MAESLPFFVAEVSANHNGSLSKAKKLIYTAKKNGADAVKIQSYSPSTMTLNSKNFYFKIKKGLGKIFIYGIFIKKSNTF